MTNRLSVAGEHNIKKLFFESPWLLVPTLVIIQLVLIRVWSNRRTPGSRRAMLIGLGLCVILPLLQALVVTDREQVQRVCAQLVRAVQDGDIDAVTERVALRFRVRNIDRDAFIKGVERALTRTDVDNASIRRAEIEVTQDVATVQLNVVCTLATRDELFPGNPSFWTIRLEKIDGEWLLIEVEPRPAQPWFPFSRLEQLMP